jgi:Tol biopolymer transport system component
VLTTPSAGPLSALAFAAAPSSSDAGHILFERDGALWAQGFLPSRREQAGELVRVAGDLATRTSFTASGNGVIAYRSGGSATLSTLAWFDRRGPTGSQLGPPGAYGQVIISEDGKIVAVSRSNQTWTVDVLRGVFSRLNPGDAVESSPAVSPDGRVAFTITSGSTGDIYAKRVGGVDAPELLVKSETIKHPNHWSRDGRFLIYDDHHPSQRQDLWIVQTQGDRTPFPFLVTPADETFGQFSQDGRWITYSSDESGRRDVYVRGFAPDRRPAAAVGQWQISPEGGDKPRWSHDGKELFYIAPDGKMMAVQVKTASDASTFEPGVAVPLFDTRVTGFVPYDVTPDGRFLINTLAEASAQSPITVVVNWLSALQ